MAEEQKPVEEQKPAEEQAQPAPEKKKKEKKRRIKTFFADFKTFINKGNVLDMAVGVIIGGAFSAIVTALSNQILKPIINWILALVLGKGSLNELYTVLVEVRDPVTNVLDLEQSIYIDWGAFINAIINFILIALVLFIIIKVIIKLQKLHEETNDKIEKAVEKRLAEREAQRRAESGEAPATEEVTAQAQEEKPKTE